ncbi:MAG: hypothetical protein KJO07_06505 [Deltaproteobacteria bacterium]|nr:hypothetical protein [Deltaproteobacteria bacterium]
MGLRRVLILAPSLVLACGGDSTTSCDEFDQPSRPSTSACDPVGDDPRDLGDCRLGSGYAGLWSVDIDGLPIYELTVEERCDPAGRHDNQLGRGPVHLIGNGRGLTALAHASGAVEVFSQDRGHKWLNHVDTWEDESNPDHPLQVGGGWSYIVDDGEVRSTRHADLAIGGAADDQVRRFGPGYVETVTRLGDIVVKRRVFAPDLDTRAVVAEVDISNLASSRKRVGLVELWDVNLHQLSDSFSEDVSPSNVAEIQRRRRARQSELRHTASYVAEDRVASVTSEAVQLPGGIERPGDQSRFEYFPDPVFLAVIDRGTAPEAVWLSTDEVWGDSNRRNPTKRLGRTADAGSRELELEGAGQPAVLAMRVPVELPPGTTVTRRFAFGTTVPDQTASQAAGELQAVSVELAAKANEKWRESLVYAAFDGRDDSGAIQRELAWSSYYLQAAAGFDREANTRVVSPAGALRYFYGVEGSTGEIAALAEPLTLLDPTLAADNLAFAFSAQHGQESPTPYRIPYGELGIDDFEDVLGQTQRSDVYTMVPAATALYLAFTGDYDLLQRPVVFWPRVLRETASIGRHLAELLVYFNGTLGRGAGGLIAMGSGDVTDQLIDESASVATPSGASSTFSAMVVGQRFELLADMLQDEDSAVADGYRGIFDEQVPLLEDTFSGSYYYRGFDDAGAPLLDQYVFALPQALAILARVAVGGDAAALVDFFEGELATDWGVLTDTGLPDDGASVLFGHVRPAISGWVTAAASRADAARGFALFVKSLAFTRAELFPNLWYGIWSGPESYVGSGNAEGMVGSSIQTAFGDEPALNVHPHAASIRGLMGVLGLSPTVDGIRIDPRVPGETFHVIFPQLELYGTPTSIGGSVASTGSAGVALRVTVPTGLRATALRAVVDGQPVEAQVDGSDVTIDLPPRQTPVAWSVSAATN